jgi:L-glutamine-phosphate cytidylyltransferase
MPTQVLILAAGRGSRLGPRTADIPKPLLQVGPRMLIEHQLEMFAEAGVGPVGMVVGYQADEIAEVVGIRAEYIPNARWSTTNSLYSFLQARSWVRGDLIISNCDILLHPRILARVIAAGGDCFAYDSASGHGLEHMKVQLEGRDLVRMSKTLEADQISGENVGLLSLKEETVQHLFEIAERRVADGGAKDWLGVAVQELAEQRQLRGVDVAGLPWAEIDFGFDLNRARKDVWPAIRARPSTWRPRIVGASAAAAVAVLVMGMVQFPVPDEPVGAAVEWQIVQPHDAEEITLAAADGTQKWWLLPSGGVIEADLSTFRAARVESRTVLGDGAERVSYRMEITIEGRPPIWHQFEGRPSMQARYLGMVVSSPAYHHLDAADLPGRIRIEGTAPGGAPILVRIREAPGVFSDDDSYHTSLASSAGVRDPLGVLFPRTPVFHPRGNTSIDAKVPHAVQQ